MALTSFQDELLRLLADNCCKTPGSYVAVGLALNFVLGTPCVSRDIDIFHDTVESLIEAEVSRAGVRTEIQWGIDSAYRFFPLVKDEVAGFTLHPLDLAANKLAVLVGRTEPRNWIDVITASRELQPLACLLSAACGKNPGLSPTSMLEYVARRQYNQVEIDDKILPKGAYDAAELCRYWHEEVDRTRQALSAFPREEAGKAVTNADGSLFNGTDEELVAALKAGELQFHAGRIGGAWPRIIG